MKLNSKVCEIYLIIALFTSKYAGKTRLSKLRNKLRTCDFCGKCARAVLISDNTMQQRGEAVSANHCRKAENNEYTEPIA